MKTSTTSTTSAEWAKIGRATLVAACFLVMLSGSTAVIAEQNGTSAVAAEVVPLAERVLNLDVTFKWIAGSDRFWFKRQTRSGDEFVVVDSATGQQRPMFDTGAMRAALNAARPGTVGAAELPISELTFESSGSHLVVTTPSGHFDCDAPVTRCTERAAPPGPDLVVSPDGHSAVLRRGNDLWLRDLAKGQERRLTEDGEPDFGYGDFDGWPDMGKVIRRRGGVPSPLLGVIWSPDGRYVVALRQDLRPFPERLLVTEYVPPDGGFGQTHFQRFGTAGDPKRPDSRLVVIDTRSSAVHAVALDSQALNDYALEYLITGVVWWSKDGGSLFLLTANRGGTRYALNSVDLETGHTREILNETARFNVRLNPSDYARPNVHVSSKGDEIIWYSERNGYGHLYLYDAATGKLKRPLTRGNWVVFDLLRVDEVNRLAYFTAGPRNGAGNPYNSYLYRVSLDGGEPHLLTPEIANHEYENSFGAWGSASESRISPSSRYFIDSYSSTDQPPKVVVRKVSGELIGEVLTSDASALYATGWRPPERVVVKASDGVTDLYGVMFLPRNFDPSRKYPIIDYMYPGPQGRWAPLLFTDNIVGYSRSAQAFADAGFIVVSVDGRGTADRSRAFRDAFLGSEDVFGASDHVAAIKNLAGQHPYMDLQRVGVMGHSFGGYGSLRAMLLYPDFFKVGVSGVGPGEWFHITQEVSVERMFGVPAVSPEVRAFYDVVSNTRLASRLQGRVLLIYGGIDENVPLVNAFVVFDAFIKANKDIDMLIIPDSPHGAPTEPYAVRRSIQYFMDHLAAQVTQ